MSVSNVAVAAGVAIRETRAKSAPLSPQVDTKASRFERQTASVGRPSTAVVIVSGITPGQQDRPPYSVTLTGSDAKVLTIGRIAGLDTGGGATISKQFNLDLTGFTHVIVRDAAGKSVLSGDVTTSTTLSTPSP